MKLSLDFETRSEVDLKLAGVYVYAAHPSTQILCAAYSIDGAEPRYWAKWAGQEMPIELAAALGNPQCEVHAWNSQFERLITKHKAGFDIPIGRYRCTAAWARCAGLPGSLESALEFIGKTKQLRHKREGHHVMLKWCRPLREGGWAADRQEYLGLVHYCLDDVRSEMLLQGYLADTPMTDAELADFDLSERINDRGLPIDIKLAQAAQTYGKAEKDELQGLLSFTSDGEVETASQHARIKNWLRRRLGEEAFLHFFEQRYEKNGKEVVKISTDKRARAEFLLASESQDYPEVRDFVEIVDDANKSSVIKYATMAARAAATGRAEGSYLAFGAVQTKRYSSRGVQAHNFPRDVPADVPGAVQAVLAHEVEGKVMHVLASLLRPTIKAPEGRTLVWGDWSAVEARGMPWLADCQWKLDLYRQGVDVYRVNAQDIFDVPLEEVDDRQRQVGKVAELSLQFGGAMGALRAMGRNYGIGLTKAEAERTVARWRRANDWATRFAYQLKEAYDAVVTYRRPRSVRGITYESRVDSAYHCTVVCTIPGGTRLYYPGNYEHKCEPIMREVRHKDGSVRYEPTGQYTVSQTRRALSQRGPIHRDVKPGAKMSKPELVQENGRLLYCWSTDKQERDRIDFQKAGAADFRTETVWHGLLAENVTQALCAALLRDCLSRVEAGLGKAKLDAFIVGHTHDEILLEASVKDAPRAEKLLAREMVRVPEWLAGFPLAAQVKTGQRYGK